MKKLLVFVIGIAFLAYGCDPKETDEFKKLQAKADSLEGMTKVKDNSITDFIVAFNQIQNNLNTIKEKEKIITVNSKATPENKEEMAAKMNDDIQSIYNLVTENKKKIATLNKKLKKVGAKVTELEKMIAFLNQQIAEKDIEIEKIKGDLEKKNIQITAMEAKIDTLIVDIQEKDKVIDAKTEELNTAYYAFGKEKELIKENVLAKGGLAGLAKSQKLAENFNKEYFTKINITKLKAIPLFAKKARVITAHPTSSYKLVGQEKVDSLIITNPAEFWGTTKYCVIVVD
ncbi:MAG: hypothetical protein HY958_05715 [Bacteroidia bacterium]|nr:hypothetical protein [Bacteroidia bacterium]